MKYQWIWAIVWGISGGIVASIANGVAYGYLYGGGIALSGIGMWAMCNNLTREKK